jgi:hypothetical protein
MKFRPEHGPDATVLTLAKRIVLPLTQPLFRFWAYPSLHPHHGVSHHSQAEQRKQRLELQRVLLLLSVAHLHKAGDIFFWRLGACEQAAARSDIPCMARGTPHGMHPSQMGVRTDVRLHAEAPRVAFLAQMHFRVVRLFSWFCSLWGWERRSRLYRPLRLLSAAARGALTVANLRSASLWFSSR